MNRKQLGNSHLSVTPMGLGLAALGRPGYINLGHGDDLNYNHDVTAMEAQAHRVLEIEFDGVLLFSTVQATWNLLEQSAASALREAHEAGMERFIGRDAGCVGGTRRKLLAHAQPIGLELRSRKRVRS